MHEVATLLMRSAPGWIEHQTMDATFVFQCRDAILTVFPDGSWKCVIPQGVTQAIRQGTVHNLEQFLNDFAAANLR
jgi:hypothetical protein